MTAGRSNLAIFWISLVGLYLELLLIRWIGTEVRIFAYLQNTILVVCFFGLGIGLFTSRRSLSPHRGLLSLVALAVLTAFPATREILDSVSSFLSVLGDINIWAPSTTVSTTGTVISVGIGLVLTFAIMLLVLEPFIPIGRLLGRLLDEHPKPLVAYSINVAGSLAGIWLFVGLGRLSQPPAVWFVVLVGLVLPVFLWKRPRDLLGLGLLATLVPLTIYADSSSGAIETRWSPYQKLELFQGVATEGVGDIPTVRYDLRVNQTFYQYMLDLSQSDVDGPSVAAERLTTYDVPALVHPSPEKVLVVGAGSGNDVAGMLRNGAGRITAVDIDPVILSMGRRYHPERPYDSDRVELVNTDARSYFATSPETYDVIAFGFLDAHTTTSLTNARLDHYVYTVESFERVRGLLKPGGIVTVAFFPVRPFITDRLAGTLKDVFGEAPLAYWFPSDGRSLPGVLLIAGDLETARARIDSLPELSRLAALAAERPVELSHTTQRATDDWPYLYLDQPRIPLLFPLLAGLLVLLALYASRTLELPGAMNPRRWDRSSWHFFLLGAAFLLLEVQNISKASVVLGNTWIVNAVIISGVLAMVLAANVVVLHRPTIPLAPVYALLILTVLGLYFVDLARFAFLPPLSKSVLVGGLTTFPMFFSGIAFARAFEVAPRKDYALGANLLGALLGAILESVSFLLGIKALLLVVAVFYAAAALTRPGRGSVSASMPSSAPGT